MDDKIKVVDETKQFVIVEADLLKELLPTETYVYSILKFHAGNKRETWFGLNTLVKEYNLTKPTLIKAIDNLIEKRIIGKDDPDSKRRTNTYYILR